MDALRVAVLREVLAGSEWLRATRDFGGSLRAAVRRGSGGLLLVGTAEYEPWHLAAHLDEEAAWSGLPELAPTLVRHRVPPGAPRHLAVDVARLTAAGRGETLLVIAPGQPAPDLLERLADARRAGATLLALDASPDATDLHSLTHTTLTIPPTDHPLTFDLAQHLVSTTPTTPAPPTRLTDVTTHFTTPPPRW